MSAPTIQQFLIRFDRGTGELEVEQLGTDADAAAARYLEVERDHPGLEVVLIGADSLDTIRITHPHYFNRERGTDSFTQLEQLEQRVRGGGGPA